MEREVGDASRAAEASGAALNRSMPGPSRSCNSHLHPRAVHPNRSAAVDLVSDCFPDTVDLGCVSDSDCFPNPVDLAGPRASIWATCDYLDLALPDFFVLIRA